MDSRYLENLLRGVTFLGVAAIFGCGVSGGGAKDAAALPAPAPVVIVSITPGTASLIAGATQQFHAIVTGTSNAAVTWTVSDGSIDSTGLFTAAANPGSVTITATSGADAMKNGTATVAVSAPPPPATPTAELAQASGTAQSAGQIRNSPIIGAPIAAQSASAGATTVRSGFSPQ